MTTYAIGDIQGCYKPLRKLLHKVKFNSNRDKLWCVGDLINRGPDSLDTLRFLKDLDKAVICVLGNHDLHFLAIYYGVAPDVNKGTLQQLLKAQDCHQLASWLRKLPLAHYDALETDSGIKHYLMIHAGVAPQWTLQLTLNLAAEVELALRGTNFKDFFRHMYGNTPTRWHPRLTGKDRLRAITNTLTRIRFCDPSGNMNMLTKEGLPSAPKGLLPWYEFERITPKATLLFGHWAALDGITNRKNVHALDTGCVWGRRLTLMRLEDQKLFCY